MGYLGGRLAQVDRASLFDALEMAAAHVGLALFVVHVDASPPTVIYASPLLGKLVGRPNAELVGQPPWELVAPSQRQRVRDTIASRGPGAPPITLQYAIERPDGSRREIEVSVARITASDAELAVCYIRDTTTEHEAVTALRRSEQQFRSLIENAPDGVVILQQGCFVLANPPALRMLGAPSFESVRGRQLAEFMKPGEASRAMERIRQLYAGGEVRSSEYQILNNDLVVEVHSVLCEYEGKPSILSFVRDTTERRLMQEQIFRAHRLAAIGTMAATVAHEINNPLTYLQLTLQSLARQTGSERDPALAALLQEHVANALHGVERVARIVRDLRTYSRDQNEVPDVAIDVVAVIDQALQMVSHDLSHRATLVRRNPSEPAYVEGSADRLEQIVINLLVNALQALDGGASARSEITVDIELSADQVQIVVGDTGPGITAPERVFDPFFTTKPVGQGTGLGLSVCKQLAERMRGRIELLSTGPAGTKFAVTLPRCRAPAATAVTHPAQRGGERLRLLVIDDEPRVLDAMKELLELDHDVEIADDGEAALAMLCNARYDVILCDVMMPRMNGRDVYERIRVRWPGLERRVVFITGGAFVPSVAIFLESVTNLTLRKPFTIEQVLALVDETNRRAAAAP